jgi:hypothetical protein
MRFFHKNPAAVLAYLEQQRCPILMLDWEREPKVGGFVMLPTTIRRRAANPAKPVDVSEVAFFAGRGNGPKHAVTVLQFYFHVNSTAVGRPMPVMDAVEFVEASGAETEFLLAGHPDSGLVSISRVRQPFQQGLEPVTWWGQ